MGEIAIGIDIAKHVFQPHGVDAAGKVVRCRRLRRGQVAALFATRPPSPVGIEACCTAHSWAREIAALGHDVRRMSPGYVKPYVKRNKHDAADAEAVCERRPSMRFVPDKSPQRAKRRSLHMVSAIFWSGNERCSSMHCGATWPSLASSPRVAFTRPKSSWRWLPMRATGASPRAPASRAAAPHCGARRDRKADHGGRDRNR